MEASQPFQGGVFLPFLPQRPIRVCDFLVIGVTGTPTLRTKAEDPVNPPGWQHQQKQQAEGGAGEVLGAILAFGLLDTT